jgi:hypothetical protein
MRNRTYKILGFPECKLGFKFWIYTLANNLEWYELLRFGFGL